MKKTDDPISIQDTYQQELQRDLVNILKRFKRVFKKKLNNSGLLQKSKKNDLQMLGSDPKAAEVVDFAHNNLIDKNPDGTPHLKENWANWYVKQYKKNPSIHTPENQEKIKHFMGMKHLPQVANFEFKNDHDTFDKGIQGLKDAEAKGSEKLKSDENRWAPIEPHHKVIQDLGNGFAWWSLGKPFDEKEGKAMNHCGNVEGQSGHGKKDILYSLRLTDPSKPGLARPSITAVNNGGYLGEIKGYANSKPSEKFHDAMVALLLHKNIKGVVGSGYAPEANFQGTDLSPEQYQQVISKKPRIFNPDKSDLPPKFSERDDLSPEVTDLSAVAHKDPEAAKILQEKHNKKFNTTEKIRKEFAKLTDIKKIHNYNTADVQEFAKQALNNPALDPESLLDVMGSLQLEDYKHHPLIDQTMKYMTPGVKAERGLLDHPSVTQQEFDEAIKAEPNMVIHNYHSNHPMISSNHIDKLIVGNQGQANIQKLAEHPNFSPELIQKVQDKKPHTSAVFLSKNKNFNQGHLDDLLRNGHDQEVINVLANRPDLSIPKEKYTQIVSDLIEGSTNPAIKAQGLKHDIKNHPLTDEKELTKLIDTTPRTGWTENGIYDHPKMTPELKERVKKDFLANVRNPSHNDTYKSEIEKSPVFKEDPEFYKQEFKKAYSAQHNGRPTKWHTPEEHDSFYKQKIAEGSNPADSTTDWFFSDSHASDDTKRMLANHPDMLKDKEKAIFAGKYLNDDEKLRLMLGGNDIQDGNVPSHVIDKYLDAQPKLGKNPHLNEPYVKKVSRQLNHENIKLTPQQVERLEGLGYNPVDYSSHMNDEQRKKYAGQAEKLDDKYKIMVGSKRDFFELPLKTFKKWYRGVTDDSPQEQRYVARQAMYDEQEARNHQLLTRTLGQNAKPEDLERYKNSHDEDVRIAARQEIERRKGLQKSVKLIELLKKSEPLEKRSKNVREQTRNITPEQALARRLKYAMSLGLNPQSTSKKGFPEAQGNTVPYNDKFGIEHEVAHAVMTPKGSNISSYQKELTPNDDNYRDYGYHYNSNVDESIANRLESMIDRRAGVGGHASKFRVRAPLDKILSEATVDRNEEGVKGAQTYEHKYLEEFPYSNDHEKSTLKPFTGRAKPYIDKFDQGAKFTPDGKISEPLKTNNRIRANMDDKLQKMCNYLRKAKANKTEALEKEEGMISNANAQMNNPITSAISSAASAVGNWFSGDSDGGSGKAAGANLDRSTLDHNSGAMKNAFSKSKKILEKAKIITPEDVIKQYNVPKIKTKTTQNVMTYQDKEPKENVLKYDEINKIKTKPSDSSINYQALKAPIDNEPNWKKKLRMGKSEEDNDSHMADSDLNSVNHHSQEIKQNLDPNKDLPDWVDSKINTSANEMSDVAHYLESNPQDSKKQMTEVLKKCKMKMAKAWKPIMD